MLNRVAQAGAAGLLLGQEIRISEPEFMRFRDLVKRVPGVEMPLSGVGVFDMTVLPNVSIHFDLQAIARCEHAR